jgi:hypothetical protein
MSRVTVAGLPGQKDINGQFTIGANIHRTLALFKKIYSGGTYEFGALTAAYNNYVPGSGDYDTWMSDAGTYPPDAQDKIKNCIIQALIHTDKDGKDDPIPVTITWDPLGRPQEVKCTFDPSGPSYTIKTVGYPEPPKSLLAERRGKKKT